MPASRRKFKTEVRQLLDLVIHSLYTNRDIFLRELISNASDAIDRARFECVSNPGLLEGDPDWKIKLHADTEARTLTVSDNGIGMSREEVDKNIGTIASSGTRRFLEEAQKEEGAVSPELIGQFGVGFYSAFMVADRVTVVTRRLGTPPEAAIRWKSAGTGGYTVEEVEKETQGTDVILHLKEDVDEYLEEWKIRKIVKTYSDFVEPPIVMDVRREETPTDDEGNPLPDTEKTVTVEEETLNSRKAIWAKAPDDVDETEYHEFYKHVSHDYQDPFETLHWRAEGTLEFQALVYIPQRPLFDLYVPDEQRQGLQLYVRKVFITDHCEALIPQYLRFLKGVVESADLPLNISRETLQDNRLIRTIRNNVVKKVLDKLAHMLENDRDRYVTFWNSFGRVLKEGVHLDIANRDKLQELLLFESSTRDQGELVSLKEYRSLMPDSQKAVYYLTGDTREAVAHSPYLERFRKKNIDVLFMTDPIDEWVVQNLTEYDGKPLRNIAKGEIDLEEEEDEEKTEEQKGRLQPVVEAVKNALGDRVKDVRLSRRLTDSACCLVADEAGLGIQMEKILKAIHQEVPAAKRILELNPDHPLVQTMGSIVEKDGEHPKVGEFAELLYDQALLTAGLPLSDPLTFTRRISDLMAHEAETLGSDGSGE